MTLFKSLGSRQTRKAPEGFSTTTIEFTQSVGVSTLVMTCNFSILFNSALTLSPKAYGTLCSGLTAGTALGSATLVDAENFD